MALVRRWLAEGAKVPIDAAAAQLAGVLKDPQDFKLIDGLCEPYLPDSGK